MTDFDERFAERTVREVKEDFLRRQSERRFLEKSWELNMNFLAGNQYCALNAAGEIEEEEPRFYWQYRRVFNHIAPAIDTRCAKLSRVRPSLTVRAASDEEGDLRTAKLSTAIIRSVSRESALDDVMMRATMWSETCGSSFYKVLWDVRGGNFLGYSEGEPIFEGCVRIVAVPPFEIYPDSLCAESVEECGSILHAKAVSVEEIEARYGVKLKGRDISEFSLAPYSQYAHFAGGQTARTESVKRGAELVIERYEKPSEELPDGRLTIVAGDRLVYMGALPYLNGAGGARSYPFIRQCAIELSGCFFGGSIVDRMIPVQRAFNAVKNRKHEFLNRLTMGVLAVEDGSLDTDELLEEGLSPGKVLVYRQGAEPPKMLGADTLPAEFEKEEASLLNEFILVSGVSEISSTSLNRTNVTSATGLQLLIDQDDTRLAVTTESIRRAVKEIGKHILRLTRQFATSERVLRMTGEGKRVELYYFSGSDISSDDVIFEVENESAVSPAQRRSLIYELYNMGLLADENGKVSDEMRQKILDALGFGGLENARGLTSLHTNKAAEENRRLLKEEVAADSYDDDGAHIAEHTRFLLSDEFKSKDQKAKERFERHLRAHRDRSK